MRKVFGISHPAIVLGYLLTMPLLAQEPAPPAEPAAEEEAFKASIQLYGYGGAAYGKTDGNYYLLGAQDGDHRNGSFALNLAVEPLHNLQFRAQADGEVEGDGSVIDLDYAFAEWRFSDLLRLRAGKVQHPFGLYSEVLDVGTLRPFLTLPQVMYGPVEFVAHSYDGLGLTGRRPIGDDWEVTYDLYTGEMHIDWMVPLSVLTAEEGSGEVVEREHLQGVVGGRVTFGTGNLRFGFSAFTGDDSQPGARHDSWAGHFDYLTDRIWLRSEAGGQQDGEARFHFGYLEGAYFLTSHWQVASRLERLASAPGEEVLRALAPLLEHRELAVGLNYWFTPALVLKASFHEVNGNRFARPQDLQELLQAVETGTLRRETRLIALGVQFSF